MKTLAKPVDWRQEGVAPQDLVPLTSLRFIAACLLLVHHTQVFFPWGSWAAGRSFEHGVSFFFVLSGFILTHVYSQRQATFAGFMLVRFARLWPVHIVTLLMVVLFIRTDSQQFPGTGFFSPHVALVVNALLLQSLVPIQSFVFSWNSPSWSISTEWFFYLMFPLLLFRLKDTWHWKLILFVGIIGLYGIVAALLDLPRTPGIHDLNVRFLTYASPLFRGFEFMLGMAAYLAWERLDAMALSRSASSCIEVAAAVLLAVWVFFGLEAGRPLVSDVLILSEWYANAASCFVCALIIIAVASGRGVLSEMLSVRPMVYLGQISFCLYMVHQIIMKWLFLKAHEGVIEPAGPLIVFPVCLLGAVILHHLVEKPARDLILRARTLRTPEIVKP